MSDPTATRIADTLRLASEQRNAELLASLYADDAEVRVVDRNRTPSSPLVLRGKAAIAEFFKDICERDMTHRIEQQVVGENRLAFLEACKYPDGCHVLCAAVAELHQGKIVRQVCVQAWDE